MIAGSLLVSEQTTARHLHHCGNVTGRQIGVQLRSPETRMPKTIFYCRTSTGGQRRDLQLDAAKKEKAGVPSKHVYTEKASGARHGRPKLREAVDALQPDDTFMAFKLDRVGRSLMHLTKVLTEIEGKGASFATVEDGLFDQGRHG
jgi:DNA invertase Pin-like site-specific DNA recombinase